MNLLILRLIINFFIGFIFGLPMFSGATQE